MTPHQFLLLMLGLTAGAVAANLLHRRWRHRALQELARSWRMHYTPRDIFRLASHVAPRLPLIGAADLHVLDVIYGIEGEWNRYLFTVEFTSGVIHVKERQVRVASFREPRGRAVGPTSGPMELQFAADPRAPLLEQYRSFHDPGVEPPAPVNADRRAEGDHRSAAQQ